MKIRDQVTGKYVKNRATKVVYVSDIPKIVRYERMIDTRRHNKLLREEISFQSNSELMVTLYIVSILFFIVKFVFHI